ncbi:uncharacterized protein DEA37_0002576 [Paragonimus westermani]|uniref:Uncharacterized protein n=1 Tax=Paragonimus westermani TaxID=34504 RepID=A0A5J4NCP4_9TREM|nr:uncharacterized protein DEA37_0002576 [Paragonimus westermani]
MLALNSQMVLRSFTISNRYPSFVFISNPYPFRFSLFPGAILKKATGKSVHKQVDHMRSRRPGPKDAESIPQPDQLTSRFIYMRPSGRPHDKTRSFARSAESTPTGKPQTKDTLLKTSHHESRPIEIGDLNFPRRDSTVPPLCWAQLVDQYRRLRHKHSSIDGCLPTDLMETDFLGANALRQRYDLKRTSPSLWKPSAAVPT